MMFFLRGEKQENERLYGTESKTNENMVKAAEVEGSWYIAGSLMNMVNKCMRTIITIIIKVMRIM